MSEKIELNNNALDYTAAVLKGASGVVPFVGQALGELVAQIPGQRMDRFRSFLQVLDERLKNTEATVDELKKNMSKEGFFELYEEACEQATRTNSDDRRKYLAGIVANGLTSSEIDIQETQFLLRVFEEVNDIELLILRLHWDIGADRDAEFRNNYKDIVIPPKVFAGCSEEIVHRASTQASYRKHLESLGLLMGDYRLKWNETDDSTKYEITMIGRRLLKFTGIVGSIKPN